MLRTVMVMLFVCDAIASFHNDTLGNLISNEEQPNNRSTNDRTLDELFKDAVQAYLEEDWPRCIDDFNAVMQGYKIYRRTIVNCRKKCRGEAAGTSPIFSENIDDMHFYEKKVKETLCLLRCNQEYREIAGSRALKSLPRDTEHKLLAHRAYEYLHLCYYRTQRYQDAANSVFTFLVKYPDHEASIETLKWYLTLPGVQPEAVVNLETAPYVSIYFKGVSSYENEEYARAAALFEASLAAYLESEEECRFYCEGPFDQGWHPEFTSSVANHFTFCLKCKRACSQLLNNVNGNYRRDMLKSHYNYLQFSYYKLGKLKAACAAVESYLLFDSVDETMESNKAYYRAQPKVQEEYFAARQEAVDYLKRQEYELSLLRYISNEFSIIDAQFFETSKKKKEKSASDKKNEKEKEPGKQTVFERSTLHPLPDHSSASRPNLSNDLSKTREERREINDEQKLGVNKVAYPIATEEDLGGKYRYVADGFLDSTECESLMRFAARTAVEGDGYSENKSPHSKYERFEGITIGRTALVQKLFFIPSLRNDTAPRRRIGYHVRSGFVRYSMR